MGRGAPFPLFVFPLATGGFVSSFSSEGLRWDNDISRFIVLIFVGNNIVKLQYVKQLN